MERISIIQRKKSVHNVGAADDEYHDEVSHLRQSLESYAFYN